MSYASNLLLDGGNLHGEEGLDILAARVEVEALELLKIELQVRDLSLDCVLHRFGYLKDMI